DCSFTTRAASHPATRFATMDTLTHALSGALLGRALTPSAAGSSTARPMLGPTVPAWHAVSLGLVAAAFPDSDFVLRFISETAYLRGHRGITHSLLMLPLWSLLLGWLASRLFRRPDALRRYALVAGGAIAIHIAGDWITQFGTMLLAPLSDARFGLGAIFIIDLVISGILVAGLLASALWRRSRVPALAALALLPVWVVVASYGKQQAIDAGADWAKAQGITAVSIDAATRPASPFNWTVFVFDGADYHIAHINPQRQAPLIATADDNFIRRYSAPYLPPHLAQWQRIPMHGEGADARIAREAWRQPQFALFRWFALHPALDRIDRAGTETCVWYRDMRFVFPGRTTAPFRFGLCRDTDQSPWRLFGLDDTGRPFAAH
ncbi:MAG: metal-dependent hydrolase, partial [Betaproteobacteria bacterium]